MWPWLNDNMFDTDLCLYSPLRALVSKSWRIMECVAVDEKFEMLRNEWFALCPTHQVGHGYAKIYLNAHNELRQAKAQSTLERQWP